MAARQGRPRGRCRGDSQEINTLAQLLQEQLRRAGMSVRGLCAAFEERHFPAGAPAHATVQRRLNGEGLGNQRALIEAVIELCTPANDQEAIRTTASRLMRKAAADPTPVRPEEPSDRLAIVAAELGRVRLRLLNVQQELIEERKLRAEAEKSAFRAFASLTSVLGLLDTSPPPPAGSTDTKVLDREIPQVTAQRDEAGPPRPAQPTNSDGSLSDPALDALEAKFRTMDPDGRRMAACLRRVLDQQLDGGHTGRFQWTQLSKAEKGATGTLVALSVGKEFGLGSGDVAEFELDGVEFAVRYSVRPSGWLIPREAVDGICLLITADDRTSVWSAGLVRPRQNMLLGNVQRDRKAPLSKGSLEEVRWLQRDAALPENVLARLPQSDVVAIFAPVSGQARIDELLRRVQGKRISHTVVDTVALQRDSVKRLRDAKRRLVDDGIVVLNGSPRNQAVAGALGLPVPEVKGQWVSARVVPSEQDDDRAFFEADGRRWRLADPHDPVTAGPVL
ncbi:NaeI family type II restriction endonuclease [Amycolatopsis sp. w19]|uniref:NaeI family type II restriction endonuclease n=1 Tax=Amycolatopsis sp. w19 TaxID=3448134 RepID=UPI003F1971C4